MNVTMILAFGIVGILVLLPLALILCADVVAFYRALRRAEPRRETVSGLACESDAHCPEGYVCVDGRCVLQA
jgi:hypothetical protein